MAFELNKLPRKQKVDSFGIEFAEAVRFVHVMACAARYGRLDMLQWMLEKVKSGLGQWIWERYLIDYAYDQRNFYVLSFL